VELYFHSPNTPSWCGSQLKHRDNFNLNFMETFLHFTKSVIDNFLTVWFKAIDFVLRYGVLEGNDRHL
jgi:hypothetical protein